MTSKLLSIQLKRLNRQKLPYLYLAVLAALIISNALQCADSLADSWANYYAGGRFPTFCLQSYIDIIGPLFLGFICAVLISGEKASGMLKTPLLNGISKKQLLLAKTAGVLIVALACFLFVILFSAGIGFVYWGKQIFDNAQECLCQMLLLLFPQITLVLFFVLLSLYMPNISSMMCVSLFILLLNNLFSQFFGSYAASMDFMYYLYAFSGYNGMALNANVVFSGILVNAASATILVCGMIRHINRLHI